jgi:hypothetical protein
MHVKFDRKMKVPDHPEYIQNGTITINQTTHRILEFEVIPGKYSDIEQLGFNWTFITINPVEMLI